MSKLNFYTTNELKAKGWLRRQLEIQAEGLCGNLDKVWPDIRDSAWIGGDREGWERVPYWLDGFVPLAYLLENEDMIQRAKKYIDKIIEGQKPDGWICPCKDEEREKYDTWAIQLITKVLVGYYQCSKDERIPEVVYKTLKNYYELLKDGKIKLFSWGKHRWYETFIAINFTYERYKEDWLIALGKILKEQGIDHNTLMPKWEKPLFHWIMDTHIVNIAMCLKYEAVSSKLLGEEYQNRAEALYQHLYQYNGTPVGIFTGDEVLAGLSPIQGSELCSVVELMYSFEQLYAHTGDPKWAERLEVVAFNALPATISDDMWVHQYDQLSNQMACQTFFGKPIFTTNDKSAHVFGLEPEFGCCTSNFNQGWPKFVLSSFMHTQDTIVNVVPVPSELDCDKAKITLETKYPFEIGFRYQVTAKEDFTFQIRIPSFAKNLTVNGETAEGAMLEFAFKAGETKELNISYETAPYFEERPYDFHTVKWGSLVFSVPVKYRKDQFEYEKDGVERKFPYCDYEYVPQSDWNYAYVSRDLKLNHKEISNIPLSSENPPVTITAKVSHIDWDFEPGYETLCAKVPNSRVPLDEAQEIELYPYGASKLRMTEIPLVEK